MLPAKKSGLVYKAVSNGLIDHNTLKSHFLKLRPESSLPSLLSKRVLFFSVTPVRPWITLAALEASRFNYYTE